MAENSPAEVGESRGLLDYGPAAWQLAARILGRAEGAEDVVQEAYCRAIGRVPRGMPPEEARLWFLRVAANVAKDHRKSEARRARREAAVSQEPRRADGARDKDEMLAALQQAMDALEEDYRVPLALCYEQNLTQRQAASVLGIPVGTVATNVNRGLERLRGALARAGYTAASAAIRGALGHTAPPVPASLAAALAKLVAAGPTSGAGATAAAVAAKGGIAVKVIVGVVLAGALAGGAALLFGPATGNRQPATNLASPPAAKGPPKLEKFALAVNREYLDGPRMEAMCMDHKEGWPDTAGNIFFRAQFGYQDGGALRVAREDGMVETVVGDDRMGFDLGLAEGPASFFPIGGAGISILGAPLEGEDKGSIFASIGSGLYKIYKNKDGRWWFKRQGKLGGQTPPTAVGKSALIGEIDTTGLGIQPDCAWWKGNVYRIDLAKGELTCVLTQSDYEEKVQEALKGAGQKWTYSENGRPIGPAEGAALSDNGTIFIQYYGKVYPRGRVFRIPADRSKVEEIVRDIKGGNKDGPGLETGWHCGPNSLYGARGDCVFMCAIDSNAFRRWKDGRVSTLMRDGEWREINRFPGQDGVVGKGKCMGPPGSLPYVWIPYPGEEMGGTNGIFRFGPVDFAKPTAGSSAGGK